MNPGLGKGFLKFGTLAHRVLLALYDQGPLRHTDLMELLDSDTRHMGTVLTRLRTNQFIFVQGVSSRLDTNEATQRIYSLEPKRIRQPYRPANASQRSKKWRDAKKMRAPSVFSFRGQVVVKKT